jgi:phosphatidylserine/phosphatidylglycerophosphate/cardiolipin synthase-like enzyme
MNRLTWLLALATACTPELDGYLLGAQMITGEPVESVNARLATLADAATTTLDVALPTLTDPTLTEALTAAWSRGVDVQVATDAQSADSAGIAALAAAGVPLRLADDDLAFFDFSQNTDVSWTGDQVQMTHSFAVADGVQWLLASRAGTEDDGPLVAVDGFGQDVAEVLRAEHIQVFGGSDATALDAYSAANKSVGDPRGWFPTDGPEMLEVRFGPQDRLIKTLIDATWGARSSVRLVTEDITDAGLGTALAAKAADGFDVEVIVGASFGTTTPSATNAFLAAATGVRILQNTAVGTLPTMMFLDLEEARDGRYHEPRVLTLTHPVWSASRLSGATEVVTDQYCDGTLFGLSVRGLPPTRAIVDLANTLLAIQNDAMELP